MRRSHRLRPAFTLVELAIVVAIAGLTTLVALRQLGRYLDQAGARAARLEATHVFARGRDEAVTRHTLVTLRIDTAAGVITLSAGRTLLARHALASQHGVRLATTRDSLSFDVRGLGYGAANTTLVLRRGGAAETLVVSRLGRVR